MGERKAVYIVTYRSPWDDGYNQNEIIGIFTNKKTISDMVEWASEQERKYYGRYHSPYDIEEVKLDDYDRLARDTRFKGYGTRNIDKDGA